MLVLSATSVSAASFCTMMSEAGFRHVRYKTFTLGLCRMYVGEK